jgi:hypothetical protein
MNTRCHPIACAAIGRSRIDAIVRRKPAQVRTVSAVPA